MSQKKVRILIFIIGLAIICLSLAALVYTLQTNPVTFEQIPLNPALFAPPGGGP